MNGSKDRHNNERPPPPLDYVGAAPSSVGRPPSRIGTTVTMTTDPNTGRVTEIHLDVGYFKTFPGYLKLAQLILGIICMACGSPARQYVNEVDGVGHNHWFLFVVVTSFIVTVLWTFFYMLRVKDSVQVNPLFTWLQLEYYYNVAVTLLYVTAFIVIFAGFGHCAGVLTKCDSRIAAGVFGIFNTIAYGLGAYVLHNDYKATPKELQ